MLHIQSIVGVGMEAPKSSTEKAGTVAAATVFVPLLEGRRGQGGRADVMDLDREVVVAGDDTRRGPTWLSRRGPTEVVVTPSWRRHHGRRR